MMVKAKTTKTITRADLAEAVYQRVGLSRTESAELVETVLVEISDTLVRGENVKLSSFGSFLVRSKSERIGRNPKTGVEVPITPRRVMVFKPSNIMKSRVNGEVVADEVGVDLNIPQHVLRFWETRFTQIRPLKRSGGRRYYRPEDVELIKAIRHLLYGQGYTIRGVQRILKEQGLKAVVARAGAHGDGSVAIPSDAALEEPGLFEQDASFDHLPPHSLPPDAGAHEDAGTDGADEPSGQVSEHSSLSFEDVHRLKAALFELNDGIKLLRQALGD
eukprot:gene13914-14031_t